MDGFIAAIERQGVQRLVDRHGMCWRSTMATNRVSNEEITSLSYVYGCQVGIPLTSDITSVYCTEMAHTEILNAYWKKIFLNPQFMAGVKHVKSEFDI